MKKTITVGTKVFEVSKKEFTPHEYRRGLGSCYDNPSPTKERIWQDWSEWFFDNVTRMSRGYFTVASYNYHMFTIEGHMETEKYVFDFRITPTHNYAYNVTERML